MEGEIMKIPFTNIYIEIKWERPWHPYMFLVGIALMFVGFALLLE
jgi:hypothetical protein